MDELIFELEEEQQLTGELSANLTIETPEEHNKLRNLDFEKSGHIGFASEKQLKLVEESSVPRRLNALPTMSKTANRETSFVYVDTGGKGMKVSIKDMLASVIRTDDKIPDDMQTGEYLLLRR